MKLLSLLCCLSLFACQSSKITVPDEMIPASSKPDAKEGKVPAPVLPPVAIEDKGRDNSCISINEQIKQFPYWSKKEGFLITQILSRCITKDGQEGYHRNSSWVAMGFPCTGGRGKINVAGTNYSPKMVSLVMSTDCPMDPGLSPKLAGAGQKILGLDANTKLLAMNPMAVQYWETETDSDVGFAIELRSVEARQRVWRNFIDKKPLSIRLYGRENAWVMGNQFYEVTGQLWHTSNSTFRLEVLEAKALTEAQAAEVQARCQELRPRRDCHRVFN